MGFKLKKLEVWQRAVNLSLEIHTLTRKLPINNPWTVDYGLWTIRPDKKRICFLEGRGQEAEGRGLERRLNMDEYQKGLAAIKEAIEILKEKFSDKIYSVILYGSFARGKKDFDDIDIVIITKDNLGGVYEVTNMFTKEVFCNLLHEYGLLFSVLVYDQKNFRRLRGFPLYEEIKKGGVLLYGKKILVKKTIKSLS